MNTSHSVVPPPREGFVGAIRPAGTAPAPADGLEEPLRRLDRALARMDALMTLLENDLARQRKLLASLGPRPVAAGRPGVPR